MKMFVLVRKDLSKSQQGVQGGHALAQFALDHPYDFKEWGNQTIVYLKTEVDTLTVLANEVGDTSSPFYEPDIGNELTALAIYGPDAEARFRNFRLM